LGGILSAFAIPLANRCSAPGSSWIWAGVCAGGVDLSIFDDDDLADMEALPEVATWIGHLCHQWAELEYSAQMLFAVISEMPRDQHTLQILRNFEFRDLLQATKVAAVARIGDAKLADEVIETVDHIDNTLRPRRNRLVHDRWAETGEWDRALRISPKPRLQKPQAFQPRQIVQDQTEETIGNLIVTFDELAAYVNYLFVLTVAVAAPAPKLTRGLLAERPPRPFLPRRPGMRHPKGNET
jgi:hypothetical protein